MKYVKQYLFLFLLAMSCKSKPEMKFEKVAWSQTQKDGTGYFEIFINRKKMLQDVTENEKLKGLTVAQLIEKLGKPADYVREQNIDEGEAPNSLFYDIGMIYSDVEQLHYEYLDFKYDKNNIVTDFTITDSRDNQVTTVCWSSIINQSNKDIIVEIAYKEKNYNDGMPTINFTENEMENAGKVMSYDTANFIAKIKVLPKQKFYVEGMQVKKPSFRFIKSITIIADKTIALDNKQKMQQAFVEKNSSNFEIEVK
jgi:hypothetical protein